MGHQGRGLRLGVLAAVALLLVACGGGGGSSAPAAPSLPPTVTVGGTINGLAANVSITLSLNGTLQTFDGVNTSTRSFNYAFTNRLDRGSNYNVVIQLLPINQLCTLSGGSGTASTSISTVRVDCIDTMVNDVGVAGGVEGATGRDAAAAAGILAKRGAGIAGFDFTRVCNSGATAGAGGCPATPVQGAGANDWGCTRDTVTELLWQAFPGSTSSDFAGAGAAVAAANGAALCGRSDWRLPDVIELTSLVHSGAAATAAAVDTAFFPDTGLVSYWSGEARANDADAVWAVEFGSGAVGVLDRSDSSRTRVVAGTPPPGSLTLTSATIFRDSRYALTWLTTGASGSFAEAVDSAAGQNSARTGGFADWRLPNRNELGSLVDRTQRQPSIDPSLGTERIQPSGYWTTTPLSTASAETGDFAWVVDFDNGDILPRPLADVRRILLVRSTTTD